MSGAAEQPRPRKPRPVIEPEMEPFWEALSAHRFVLQRCSGCGAWYWPAADCDCGAAQPFSGHMRWEEASGRGTVFAFNIHRVAFHPAFADDVPYVYALIALEEGPTLGTRVVGCDPEAVRIGMPLRIDFLDSEDGYTLPVARPAEG